MSKSEELLNFAVKSGIIDIEKLSNAKEMSDRKDKLAQHKYKIWQGKNGYWYTHIPDETKKEGRKLIRKKTQKEVEDYVVKLVDSKAYTPTIEQVFHDWNDSRLERMQISNSTYLRNRQVFNRHYADFGKNKIGKVDHTEYVEFLEDEISTKTLKPKAWANLKTVSIGIMKYSKRHGYSDLSADRVIEDMEVSRRCFDLSKKRQEEEVFTEDEYPKIIAELRKNRDIRNLAILLIFATGLRRGECVALKWEDFNEDGTFYVNRTETRYKDFEKGRYVYAIKDSPKTVAGQRLVIIPEGFMWVLEDIKSLSNGSDWLFIKENGKRMKSKDIADRLLWECKRCGVPYKSPHKIRKTYASILLDAGVDQNLITQQLGHTSIGTTEFFYHRNRKNIETKKRIISNIDEFSVCNQN